MGILEKIIRLTPFYDKYKAFKKKQNDIIQQKLEAKYLPLRINFYRQFIKPNDLVFDVGANVGNRVLPLLECGARVVAVEPQPSCVQILKDKFQNKITIESVGLSEKEGELEMAIATDTTVSSFSKDYIDKTKDRFEYSQWVDTIKVPVTTMDNLISIHGTPRFCKIDVEGFELEVLKGLHSKIPIISIEYCVPEMKSALLDCLNYWQTIAPNATYNYSVGENMNWAMTDWKSFADFTSHVNSSEFTKTSFGDVYIKSD